MHSVTRLLGILSIVLVVTGILFKINSMMWADNILITGLATFVLGFSPLFLKSKLAEEVRSDARISYAAFFASSVLLMVSALLRILGWSGAAAFAYFSLVLFMIYIVFFSRSQDGRKLRIRKDRQLAAIMFTDIVGYTRMMGQDEESALMALELNRQVHKKWLSRYRGKLLKEVGDGTIAIFYTATEAVLCATELQKEIKAIKGADLRIGIHVSEVVFTDTDAFGDGVNIASRISNQAQAGEIVFSEVVYENIRNREDLTVEALEARELKNVDRPLALYRMKMS